jgi:hypothetical protein
MSRAAALFLVAPFLTFASALAPQHVHEVGHSRDHAVAHSHFNPHHTDHHESVDLEIEHDAADHGSVVWLDSSLLHELPYQQAPAPSAIPVSYEIVPVAMHWSVTSFDAAAPVHGPPKGPPRFRGPPLPLA